MKISVEVGKKALKNAVGVGVAYFEGSSQIPQALKKKFNGKDGEFYLDAKLSSLALLIGLGKKEKYTLEKVRRAAARLLGQAKASQLATLTIQVDSFIEKFSTGDAIAALTEGLMLSSYRFDKYKSKPSPASATSEVVLMLESASYAKEAKRALAEALIVCEGVSFTRNIANEPANVMTPVAFAQAVRQMALKNNLTCRVLGLSEIKKLKMGGILGVSQGSSFPPQLVILENKVKSKSKPIVLVGKGVTFDTGGISLKPGGDMDKMKFDMCGAAAVAGALKAIGNLNIGTKVIGIMPLVENMPDSLAQRPGDIIRCHNGKTVEVLNTDAEGRLILADALSYAKKFEPKLMIDIATLTGACAAAFSDLAVAVMGTDPKLVADIREAGEKTGERCWELPLWDEYAELIKATYADLQNISKRQAGTITAGMFLKEFADHTSSWAHLDIAGTAWNNGGAKALSPIGATGVGVRLFVELVKSHA